MSRNRDSVIPSAGAERVQASAIRDPSPVVNERIVVVVVVCSMSLLALTSLWGLDAGSIEITFMGTIMSSIFSQENYLGNDLRARYTAETRG